MISFISLSSGSNGNCYFIGNEDISILIDVGVGVRTIKKRLSEYNISIELIDLVLITHDHIDHVKHLGSFAERYKIPVWTTDKLYQSLLYHPRTKGKLAGCRKIIVKDGEYNYKGVKITPFEVSHDATDTIGYYIDFLGEKFTLITDVGKITDEVISYAKKANHLILESNYDYEMLVGGSYPKILIDRIRNGRGHLCNNETADALKQIYHSNLRTLFLCHLSENNNTPDLAYKAAFDSLSEIGVIIGEDLELFCLPRKSSFHYSTGIINQHHGRPCDGIDCEPDVR
ncbi:MAG: MBL fold metallo-hydrolase [Rikenellaceae bacterium]